MPSNSVLSHICEAWQPENYAPLPTTLWPGNEFLIEIFVSFMYESSPLLVVAGAEGDEFTRENGPIPSSTTYKMFRLRRELITKDPTSWSTISNMLSQVSIPYHIQPFMIGKISEAARSIVSASENCSVRTLPMVVSIQVVVPADEEPDFSENKSVYSHNEGLQKVRIEKNFVRHDYAVDDYQCVICLEEISVGSEAVATPCSHYYHGDCIVNWLHRSSLCPLCRFQLPLSQ